MIIDYLNNKEYKIPKGLSETIKLKHNVVIKKGYAKYLEAIALSGGFCMFKQFGKLIDSFNNTKELTEGTIEVYTTLIIKELEELNFVKSEYLNKMKYIHLRHSAFVLVTGDLQTGRRINKRNAFKLNRFTINIMKMEFLIKYKNYYSLDFLEDQLIMITRKILELIESNGNLYKYDVITIKKIIELQYYKDIKKLVEATRESKNMLGVVRFVWGELAKEFWQLKLQGQAIDKEPFYLKLNILDNGRVTLHYAPTIILYDTAKDIRYYKTQTNRFFNMFFKLENNFTQNLQQDYLLNKTFGYDHFNRIGYTIKLVGSIENNAEDKINILNKAYFEKNETDETNIYSPLVYPCSLIEVDISEYFLYARDSSKANSMFMKASNNLNNLLELEKEREGL